MSTGCLNDAAMCKSVEKSHPGLNEEISPHSLIHIRKQYWKNWWMHIQTHSSSFCHVKSWTSRWIICTLDHSVITLQVQVGYLETSHCLGTLQNKSFNQIDKIFYDIINPQTKTFHSANWILARVHILRMWLSHAFMYLKIQSCLKINHQCFSKLLCISRLR